MEGRNWYIIYIIYEYTRSIHGVYTAPVGDNLGGGMSIRSCRPVLFSMAGGTARHKKRRQSD